MCHPLPRQVSDLIIHAHSEALSPEQQAAGVRELCRVLGEARGADPHIDMMRFSLVSSLHHVRRLLGGQGIGVTLGALGGAPPPAADPHMPTLSTYCAASPRPVQLLLVPTGRGLRQSERAYDAGLAAQAARGGMLKAALRLMIDPEALPRAMGAPPYVAEELEAQG